MKATKKRKLDIVAKKTDKQNSNSELLERTEVKDTPFVIITAKDKGSFVSLGKYRITEEFKTKQEAIEDAKKITWNKIVQVTALLNQHFNKIEK